MGTNYYLVANKPSIRPPIHIGKSSAGWLFCFQGHNDRWHEPPAVWNNYEELKEWLLNYTVKKKEFVIIDEYDRTLDYEDFIKLVASFQKDEECRRNPYNFKYDENVGGYRFCFQDFC